MGKKAETQKPIDDVLEEAVSHEVDRAARRAWLTADELGTADEDIVSAEVGGAVRLEATRAARGGATAAKVKAVAEEAYRDALEAALKERGFESSAAQAAIGGGPDDDDDAE